MKRSDVSAIADKLKKKKILVFGDVILDCYKYGAAKRLSPEAAVPVFEENSTQYCLGGAANVACNLVACNQQAALVSVVGDDVNGKIVCDLLQKHGIDSGNIVADGSRKTTLKTRFYTEQNNQLLRVDDEDVFAVDGKIEQALIDNITGLIDDCHLVIISDYAKGAVSQRLASFIIKEAHRRSVKVLADPKTKPFTKYYGIDVIKPNQAEFAQMTGRAFDINSVEEECDKLCKEFCFGSVVVTCGSRGIYYFGDGEHGFISANGVFRPDVSGAGDTVAAYIAAALANGTSLSKAVLLANFAAGLKVEKRGAVPVSLQDIAHATDKILTLSQLEELRGENSDKRIVFTNGCFDILHAGHVESLQTAAQFGDILVVGVNSDGSVRRLKGEGRPVFTLESRLKVLAALECVDYVVCFDEDTPLKVIELLRPDFLVKGADYSEDEVVGGSFVKSYGGQVKLVPIVSGLSTTAAINRINQDE